MIIDTHCHLDDTRYIDDFSDVIKRAQDYDVKKFIIPGADPDTLNRAIELADSYDNIYFAVGVHPYDIDKFDVSFLEKFIKHPKCVAVGECGLDYYRLPKERHEKELEIKRQKEVFIEQIELANRYNKPLIVHVREASLDSLNILKEYSRCGGVLHCFNANQGLLELKDYGFYYGIGGVLTFKNAKKLVEVLPKIPLERIVLETDAPYLTPHPFRGKRNEPSYTRLVLEKASEILDIDEKVLENRFYENSTRLFKGIFSDNN